MSQIDQDNFRTLLSAFIEQNGLTVRRVASAIRCSESTLDRLLSGMTWPSDEMLRQGAFLIELGFERYSKLSNAEREKISDALGTISGGTLGFASVTAAVGALGSVAGLSAAGISSGLAAMGSVIGGGMAAGVVVAAALPVAAAGAGYGVVRAVKHAAARRRLNDESLDLHWEILPDTNLERYWLSL